MNLHFLPAVDYGGCYLIRSKLDMFVYDQFVCKILYLAISTSTSWHDKKMLCIQVIIIMSMLHGNHLILDDLRAAAFYNLFANMIRCRKKRTENVKYRLIICFHAI